MQLIVTPYQGAPVTVEMTGGWYKITPNIGCTYIEGVGTRFVTALGGWYRIQLGEWDHEGYLPPRAILTIRPDSPAPTLGLLRPHGNPGDFGAAGGQEIDACGSGTVHDHDSIMQRCPIALYDMDTGMLRDPIRTPVAGYYRLDRGNNKTTTLPEYVTLADANDIYNDNRLPRDATPIKDMALRAAVLAFLAYNGQHIIRLYRAGLLISGCAIVDMDLDAAVVDCDLAWDLARMQNITNQPAHRGNIEVGREWAWVSYLSVLSGRFGLQERMRTIASHVQHRKTRVLLRQEYGVFVSGSPDPWKSALQGGSEVPTNVAVAQDLECYASIVALNALGLRREAYALATTVLTRPLKKWIGADDGLGWGIHGATVDQAWPALGSWGLHGAPREAIAAMKKWPIPRPAQFGGSVGPFDNITQIREALNTWNEPGKSTWALQLLRIAR